MEKSIFDFLSDREYNAQFNVEGLAELFEAEDPDCDPIRYKTSNIVKTGSDLEMAIAGMGFEYDTLGELLECPPGEIHFGLIDIGYSDMRANKILCALALIVMDNFVYCQFENDLQYDIDRWYRENGKSWEYWYERAMRM